jgi:hypothetical protein
MMILVLQKFRLGKQLHKDTTNAHDADKDGSHHGSSDMQGTSTPASDSVAPLQPKTPQEYVTVLSSWHIISWFVLIASIAPLSLESLCI